MSAAQAELTAVQSVMVTVGTTAITVLGQAKQSAAFIAVVGNSISNVTTIVCNVTAIDTADSGAISPVNSRVESAVDALDSSGSNLLAIARNVAAIGNQAATEAYIVDDLKSSINVLKITIIQLIMTFEVAADWCWCTTQLDYYSENQVQRVGMQSDIIVVVRRRSS